MGLVLGISMEFEKLVNFVSWCSGRLVLSTIFNIFTLVLFLLFLP